MVMWITVVFFSQMDSVLSDLVYQPERVISAFTGDNVTLRCLRTNEDNTDPILWYKQIVGQEPRVMVTVQKILTDHIFEDNFTSARFTVELLKGSCNLNLNTVETSDEAMYYCGLKVIKIEFGKGTFLSVRDEKSVKVSVTQHSVWDSKIPAGASVTLQCSVLSKISTAEQQVLWFKAASLQSHPQIIYTQNNSSQQCKSGFSTHSCIYNFSKNILSINDTGTYYCAVVLCGKIIFGNGTRIQLWKIPEYVVCLAVVLVVCIIVIFAQALIICKMRNSDKSKVTPEQDLVAANTLNQDDYETMEINYSALHFNRKNVKRVKKDQLANCVYSEVSYTK